MLCVVLREEGRRERGRMVLLLKLRRVQGRYVRYDDDDNTSSGAGNDTIPISNINDDTSVPSSLSGPSFPLTDSGIHKENNPEEPSSEVKHDLMDIDGDVDANTNADTGNNIPPSSVTPSTSSSSFYPNERQTMDLFRVKNYGNKSIANTIQRRLYYRCTHKGCTASYHAVISPDANGKYNKPCSTSNCVITFKSAHNHIPPSKPPTLASVKEQAISQFGAGATPANVHAKFVREAPLPLSSKDTPSMSQVKNWKHSFSMKDMPTGIAFFYPILLFNN